MDEEELSSAALDAAMAVHKWLGPGLLESAYSSAMEIHFSRANIPFEREAPIRGSYAGRPLGIVYRADFVLGGKVLIELKCVAALEPVHAAQVLTYLRLANLKLGLLLNFNRQRLKEGIRRVVNNL